jgi:ubiquinone/menaquinone biosynthesis C-methylase UbiE
VSDARLPARRTNLSRWELAYEAFETPERELRKFIIRLKRIGADQWDRRSRILEVCSGRGTGLRAWQTLGFTDVIGVDYSLALVAAHHRSGLTVLGDARNLPIRSASCDIVVIQGGLHHLFSIDDVERALSEMRRVVTPAGRIVIIEPWRTLFLQVVHAVCDQRAIRRLSPKLDALATMIEEERDTYQRWLNAPDEHLMLIRRYVAPELLQRRWGKLTVVGAPVKT